MSRICIYNEHGIHRADIYIKYKKTVIEFQHYSISNDEFNKRNKFYTLSGNRLIWIFDYSSKLTVKEDYIIPNKKDIINKCKKDRKEFSFEKKINVNRNLCKSLHLNEDYKGVSIYLEVSEKNSEKIILLPIILKNDNCFVELTKEYIYRENFLNSFIDNDNYRIKSADEIIKETRQIRDNVNEQLKKYDIIKNRNFEERMEKLKIINPNYYNKIRIKYNLSEDSMISDTKKIK